MQDIRIKKILAFPSVPSEIECKLERIKIEKVLYATNLMKSFSRLLSSWKFFLKPYCDLSLFGAKVRKREVFCPFHSIDIQENLKLFKFRRKRSWWHAVILAFHASLIYCIVNFLRIFSRNFIWSILKSMAYFNI